MNSIYKFEPAWWLNNPHLQTMWPEIMRKRINLPLETFRFELSCGDFVDLAWANRKSKTTVIVIHGLNGSVDSPYVRGMLNALRESDFNTVAMHLRGCGKELNRFPQMYHAGHTEDLREVILDLKMKQPRSEIFVVGFSVGANILLKYLGEQREHSLLSGAVAISTPFLLDVTQQSLSQGFSQIYQQYLLTRLKLTAVRKYMRHTYEQISLLALLSTRSLKHFDELVTAPLHGFKDVNEYYAHASSHGYLRDIAVPTLVIHAKDDPFFPGRCLPTKREVSRHVKLLITEKGGHVGFVSGHSPRSATYWLEKVVPYFLRNIKDANAG